MELKTKETKVRATKRNHRTWTHPDIETLPSSIHWRFPSKGHRKEELETKCPTALPFQITRPMEGDS